MATKLGMATVLATAFCVVNCRMYADERIQDRPVVNRVTMDVYVRDNSERCDALCSYLDTLSKHRSGLDVVIHNLDRDKDQIRRLYELGRQYNIEKLGLPAVHTMDRFRVGYTDSASGRQAVESMLTVEVFTRSTCPHCQEAKQFLRRIAPYWPAVRFADCDIAIDPQCRQRMEELTRHYRIYASSVPAFHLCGQLKTGFLGERITGAEIESILRKAARSLPSKDPPGEVPEDNSAAEGQPLRSSSASGRASRTIASRCVSLTALPMWGLLDSTTAVIQVPADGDDPADEAPAMDGLDPLPDMDMLPELPGDSSVDYGDTQPITAPAEPDTDMEVPFLGRLDAKSLGMPAFTFLVGLVDGFNPCAMWVLMFLLSVLVNIRERKKILIIAGTFVVVSGLAYFAFMAAWLNVFMLVGMDRPAQVILGSVAIFIGLVNVKDFFALGKGVSFKIPESAKPGLYARVRKIVAAKHLLAALTGAIILAVLVNMIELLCTAGLPAMYTQILTMQEYVPLVNYLYLGLYIVAYMLDDSLLVAIVVITLSKKKLQESQGRWLKLLSGVVILALGFVMLVKPDLLV